MGASWVLVFGHGGVLDGAVDFWKGVWSESFVSFSFSFSGTVELWLL